MFYNIGYRSDLANNNTRIIKGQVKANIDTCYFQWYGVSISQFTTNMAPVEWPNTEFALDQQGLLKN